MCSWCINDIWYFFTKESISDMCKRECCQHEAGSIDTTSRVRRLSQIKIDELAWTRGVINYRKTWDGADTPRSTDAAYIRHNSKKHPHLIVYSCVFDIENFNVNSSTAVTFASAETILLLFKTNCTSNFFPLNRMSLLTILSLIRN